MYYLSILPQNLEEQRFSLIEIEFEDTSTMQVKLLCYAHPPDALQAEISLAYGNFDDVTDTQDWFFLVVGFDLTTSMLSIQRCNYCGESLYLLVDAPVDLLDLDDTQSAKLDLFMYNLLICCYDLPYLLLL